MLRPGLVIMIEWTVFWVSWIVAARWSSAVKKRLGMKREIVFRVVMISGAVILAVPAHGYEGPLRLWLVNRAQVWLCIALIALGFGLAWWARIHLGKLWSGEITAKVDHRVVDTGPYGIVRHPIYTGIVLAVYATAAAKGTILGVVGAIVITLGVWMKARLEEVWLSGELGQDAYQAYRRRVPMLIPLGPKGS